MIILRRSPASARPQDPLARPGRKTSCEFSPPELNYWQFAPFVELDRRAATEFGLDPAKLKVSINSPGFVAGTHQDAIEISHPYFQSGWAANNHQRGRGVPMPKAAYEAQSTPAGAFFLGSPQEVIDKIMAQYELFQHDRLLIQLGSGMCRKRRPSKRSNCSAARSRRWYAKRSPRYGLSSRPERSAAGSRRYRHRECAFQDHRARRAHSENARFPDVNRVAHHRDPHARFEPRAGATRDQVDEQVEQALRAVENADLIIAATPVFRGSYTGLFKHFFDLIDQYALANKPVILAATGGSERHALVVDQALRPLFAFFQTWTAPMGIYLSSGDFDGTTVLNPEVYSRIEVAVDDVVPVARALAATDDASHQPEGTACPP